MRSTAPVRAQGLLLHLQVHVPAAHPAALRRAVHEVLQGDGEEPGPLSAVHLEVPWDGPELSITRPVAAADAPTLAEVLAAVDARLRAPDRPAGSAPVAAPGRRPPVPPPSVTWPVPGAPRGGLTEEVAHRALCAAVSPPGPGGAPGVAQLVSALPGRGTAGPRTRLLPQDGAAVRYVFDRVGPPAVPEGWLLRNWSCPAADVPHCSLTEGRRLRVVGPRAGADRGELDRLAWLWAHELAREAAQVT